VKKITDSNYTVVFDRQKHILGIVEKIVDSNYTVVFDRQKHILGNSNCIED
jgi:hypothetical protein